ncbi:hypothetical protein GCM10011384_06380 [Psychrobacillus lasiicapitis]|nr:hypothetical protein GCM10011384_06380 [Psychrobacillus lasiicapitis]
MVKLAPSENNSGPAVKIRKPMIQGRINMYPTRPSCRLKCNFLFFIELSPYV